MQSINFVFKKQEHDCYSQRSYHADGSLEKILYICPYCGPYAEHVVGTGFRHLQKSSIKHSGTSLRLMA